MGSTETTTAPAGADHPLDERTCKKCGAKRVVSPESWPYRKGRTGLYQAHGLLCLPCERERKSAYETRRDDIHKRVTGVTAPDKDTAEKRRTLKDSSKLDVAAALKAGTIALNDAAPAVMSLVLEYLDDRDSEHHIWAVEFLAQRIVPRKLYEELGGQAAGIGAFADKRPQFILNILPASTSAPQGEVYEHETPALPAPAESESDAA